MKRTLRLKAEALAALTEDELDGVAGGVVPTGLQRTCPLFDCTRITWPPLCP